MFAHSPPLPTQHQPPTAAKVFQLEDQIARLQRQIHVEGAQERLQLRHAVDSLQTRVRELEGEVVRGEEVIKKLSSSSSSGGGGGNNGSSSSGRLRASEDRYMRDEALRDELAAARRGRMELEAQLLDKVRCLSPSSPPTPTNMLVL